ncbi:MAG: hypothetical protein HQ553_11895 [Chloroflexi bacterium]|nr:hypothetical protein [Chloroflexota bacterium]
MKQGTRAPNKRKSFVLNLASEIPRLTNEQIAAKYEKKFQNTIHPSTIGKYCKEAGCPTASIKRHSSQHQIVDPVPLRIFRRKHTERLLETVDRIRDCLHNPHLELESWMGPSEPLWLGNHNWALAPDIWVELTTPDFNDENLWGSTLPLLREHLRENPFWDHLEELRSGALELAKTIDLAAKELIKKVDELRKPWEELRRRREFWLTHSRTPVFPAPNWEEIQPLYGNGFAAQICPKLTEKHLPELNSSLWGLVANLAELNEDLNPDTVEYQLTTTICSECREIKLLLGNKG